MSLHLGVSAFAVNARKLRQSLRGRILLSAADFLTINRARGLYSVVRAQLEHYIDYHHTSRAAGARHAETSAIDAGQRGGQVSVFTFPLLNWKFFPL